MNLKERNKVPYSQPKFQEEMNQYVSGLSDRIRKRHSRKKRGIMKGKRKDCKPVLPVEDYCYHTGIRFVDVEVEHPNPNDPRKRTLDHKIPLSICFVNGMTEDEANHPDNLCWALRCVNNIRGATDLESFKPIAQYYREQFIKEGYSYI
jgi:hypothetical protein